MANLETCEKMALMILEDNIGDNNPTEDDIKNCVDSVSKIIPMTEQEKTQLRKIFRPVTFAEWILGMAV